MPEETVVLKTKEIAPMGMVGFGYLYNEAIRKSPTRNWKGELVTPILIYPSKRLDDFYGLTRQDKLDKLEGEALWIYPLTKYVVDLDIQEENAIQTLILSGLENEETALTRHHDRLLTELRQRQKHEDVLNSAIVEKEEMIESLLKSDASFEKRMQEKRMAMGFVERKDEDKSKKEEKD